MRLIYHPKAEAELVEAIEFYKASVPGLGGEFLASIETCLASLQAEPSRWRVVQGDVRRGLVGRFPFGIYYRVEPNVIRVLAFKHHSRHPDYWRDRM